MNELDELSLLVYPNPASSNLNLALNHRAGEASLSIFSASGQLMISENLTSSRTVVSVEKLIPGLYHLVVNTGGQISTKRVVVQ